MKVLFVGSANRKQGAVLPIVQAQADSLISEGVEVLIYPVVGNGMLGYIKNVIPLARFIKKNNPDVVHAHYSLCGYIARLATRKPLVVSIMGSFPTESRKKKLVSWFIRNAWDATIVKSKRTEEQLGLPGLYVIPNGVNLDKFGAFNKLEMREKCGFLSSKKYVIFAADPNRPEKNYQLAVKATELLGDVGVELVPVHNVSHEKMAEYMSAGDVLLLTSIQEGSPNVIKEAMASNLPIVSTDVGDVRWLLDTVEGCYVANTFEEKEIAELLRKALDFSQPTKGRERLISIGLDRKDVAHKLISIYTGCIRNMKR